MTFASGKLGPCLPQLFIHTWLELIGSNGMWLLHCWKPGAPGEAINDGVEGALVPITDARRLARRVTALLGNSHMRRQFGTMARTAALSWDQSRTLPQLVSLVEGCL